jgi:hypothetical protein
MRRALSLATALATALGVSLALAIVPGGNSETEGANASHRVARDGAAALSPDLPGLISAFRREQTSADRLPGDPVGALDHLGDARPGESPQFARRLDTPGGAVYAWPETEGVCYGWSGSAGCTPTFVLADQGVIVGLRVIRNDPDASPQVSVAGLARDGITEVELVFDGGRSQAIIVDNNAFLAQPSDIPAEVRWTNPNGTSGTRSLPGEL